MADSVPETQQSSEFVLDDGNLIDYLIGIDTRGNRVKELSLDEFPKHLSLDWVQKPLEELYATEATGEHLTDEMKQDLRKEADVAESFGLKEIAQELNDSASEQKPLERARDFYLNTQTGEIEYTMVRSGTGFSVSNINIELRRNKKLPFLETHDHPEPTLPSNQDYTDIVLAAGEDRRMIRGFIVLNPNHQILVIATTDTPLYTEWQQGFNYLDSLDIRHDQTYTEGKGKLDEASNEIMRTFLSTIDHASIDISNIDPNKVAKAKEEIQVAQEKAIHKVNEVASSTLNFISSNSNRVSINTSRALQVAMYYSTNCKDFTKWSA